MKSVGGWKELHASVKESGMLQKERNAWVSNENSLHRMNKNIPFILEKKHRHVSD